MKANQAAYPVAMQCRILEVSTSGYYAWHDRPLSARARRDLEVTEAIRQIHGMSRGPYGAPRIHMELREQGIRVGRKRVARLMRDAGLE